MSRLIGLLAPEWWQGLAIAFTMLAALFGFFAWSGSGARQRATLTFQTNLLTTQNRQLKEQMAVITGGSSYCWLGFVYPQGGAPIEFVLFCKGEYPIYDITASVLDMRKVDAGLKTGALRMEDTYVASFNLGNKIAGAYRLGTKFTPENADAYDYQVNIVARNGLVREFLSLRRVNGRYVQSVQVTRGSEWLLKSIDKEYPKGEVGWFDPE